MDTKTKQFIFFNSILYAAFLIIDLFYSFAELSSMLKFTIVLHCFLFSSSFKKPLFMTIIADFLLLFTSQIFLGVAIFSFAHIFYFQKNMEFVHDYFKSKKIFFFIFCFCMFGTALLFFPELLVYLLYAVCFCLNVFAAVCASKKAPSKKQTLFLIGLFLFIACDVNVVIYNLTYNPISCYLIWLFYAPSQTIIALSF